MSSSMPNLQGSRRRRPPPRLRTKTGCLTCRERRKKCDEVKPRCTPCKRNWIQCRWQRSSASPDDQIEVAAVLEGTASNESQDSSPSWSIDASPRHDEAPILLVDPTEQRSLSRRTSKQTSPGYGDANSDLLRSSGVIFSLEFIPPGLRSDRDHSVLIHLINALFPFLVRAHSHPGFFDHSYILSLALNVPSLMDVLLALSSIHLSFKNDDFYPVAIGYYSSAVNTLRDMLGSQTVDGTEDWLLIMLDFLCLFERWNPDSVGKPTIHLAAAIQVFRVRLARKRTILSQITPFERTMAESMLYQSVVLSLYREMDDLMAVDVFDRLEQFYAIDPFPDAPSWANSPLLGLSPSLYRTILNVLRLSRRVPLSETDHQLAMKLVGELSSYDLSTEDITLPDSESNDKLQKLSCHRSTRLFLLGAKALLFKVMHPESGAEHPCIQSCIWEARAILQPDGPMILRYDQYLIWPLVILGCASVQTKDRLMVHWALEQIWKITHCGDAKRGLAVLEMSWQNGNPTSDKIEESEEHPRHSNSGFDILIRKDGIFNG